MSNNRWVKWFSEEDTSEGEAELAKSLEASHECLRVANMPWFRKFVDSLAEESLRPGRIGDHADMIAATSRANTYKEIRAKLLDEIARARSFIEAAKEN